MRSEACACIPCGEHKSTSQDNFLLQFQSARPRVIISIQEAVGGSDGQTTEKRPSLRHITDHVNLATRNSVRFIDNPQRHF